MINKFLFFILLFSTFLGCHNPTTTPVDPTEELPVPDVLTVEAGNKELKISWNAVKGAESYKIRYSKCSNLLTTTFVSFSHTGTTHTVSDLDNETEYLVWLIAIFANGESSESKGTAGRPMNRVYVKGTFTGTSDGSQSKPYWTIKEAISRASLETPSRVLVAAGHYEVPSPLVLANEVSLFGGYSADSWDDRAYKTEAERADPRYKTMIVYEGGVAADPVANVKTTIYLDETVRETTILEGFTVKGSEYRERREFAAISSNSSSAIIQYNTILGGANDPIYDISAIHIYGKKGALTIQHNLLSSGPNGDSVIYLEKSTIIRPYTLIKNNRINLEGAVRGIFLDSSGADIEGNEIFGGSVQNREVSSIFIFGRYAEANELAVIRNNIFRPEMSIYRYGVYESGLLCDPLIFEGNTIINCNGALYFDELNLKVRDESTVINNGEKGGSGTLTEWNNIIR